MLPVCCQAAPPTLQVVEPAHTGVCKVALLTRKKDAPNAAFKAVSVDMTIRPASPVDAENAMADEAVRAWQDLLAVTPLPVRQAVAKVVKDGAETLTEEFYDRMMRSDRASRFLDQERVQKRLRASLRRWMTDLFEVDVDLAQSIQRQIEVGVVHARIRLPIDLILSLIHI